MYVSLNGALCRNRARVAPDGVSTFCCSGLLSTVTSAPTARIKKPGREGDEANPRLIERAETRPYAHAEMITPMKIHAGPSSSLNTTPPSLAAQDAATRYKFKIEFESEPAIS